MLSTVTKQNSVNKIRIQEVMPNDEHKKPSKTKTDCKKNPLKCGICGLIISSKWNLTLHMRIHNNDRRYKCKECSASFIISHELKKHSLKHAGVKPAFKCRFCPKTYTSRHQRYLHEDTHDKKLQYKCRHCPEIFSKFLLRKIHEKQSHVKDGIFFNCLHCRKKFTSRNYLETHEKNFHKKEKGGFCCYECGQFFETSISLNIHRRVHTTKTVIGKDASGKEKEYGVKKNPTLIEDTHNHKCVICLKCYTSRADMITHMSTAHPVETKIIFKFSCNQCDKIFKTRRELIQHLVTHSNKHEHVCSLCDFKAKRNTDLKDHMLKHSENVLLKKNHEDTYNCIICLECFTFRSDMVTHMLNTHPEETKAIFKFSCDQCDKIFKKKQELAQHLITHNGKKKYCCSLCDYKSKRIADLRVHMRNHTEDKKKVGSIKKISLEICDFRTLKCNICSENFLSKEDMMTHLSNTHPEETKIVFKFTCSQCNKMFRDKQELRKHMITHNDERKFSCSLCDYKAKRNSDVKVHMLRKHTKEKVLLKKKKEAEICDMRLNKCNLCSEQYRSRTDMMNHMLNTHPEETKASFKFSCNQCDKIFKGKQELKQHLVRHDDEKKFCCSLCDFKAKQKTDLNAHLRRHAEGKSYVCEVCNLQFYQMKLFQEHKKIHFGKVFKCKLCGMSFERHKYLEWHKIKHENGGFQCDKCGKFMVNPYTLRKHVKKCKREENVKFTEPAKINIENCPLNVQAIEKCYECFECGFSSWSELTMIQHEASHNFPLSVQIVEKCYECFACGFSTCSELAMSQHETSHNLIHVWKEMDEYLDTDATFEPKKNSETNLLPKDLKNSPDKSDYNGGVLLSSCDKLNSNGIMLLQSQSKGTVNSTFTPLKDYLNIFYDHF